MKTTIYAEDFVSVADSFKNEGRIEGRNEGRNEGIDVGFKIYTLIAEGADNAEIAKIMGMTESKIEELRMKFCS